MGVDSHSKPRKGSTPGTTHSHRPTPPKRAHTSAASVTTVASASKKNATAANMNADRKIKTPLLTPQLQRTQSSNEIPKTPSPNYFGLVVEEDAANYGIDSGAGRHAKKNWGNEERDIPLEEDPRLHNFRMQSEHGKTFKLGNTLSRISTDGRVPTLRSMNDSNISDSSPDRHPMSAGGRLTSHMESSEEDEMDVDRPEQNVTSGHLIADTPSFFNMQISASPGSVGAARPASRHPISDTDARHPRGSLPQTRVTTPISGSVSKPRADTVPATMDADAPALMPASEVVQLLEGNARADVLLLDLRVSQQYAATRIRDALNLCIPTTLLKRPAFNVQKLADTFHAPRDKERFAQWRNTSQIIVYDAASLQLKDAQTCINTLKKFKTEGYAGKTAIVKGGFNAISKSRPDLIEKSTTGPAGGQGGMVLSLGAKGDGASHGGPGIQVAGGCVMPAADERPANPFFGNIRQNMDLIDGVGQMPIKRPASLTPNNIRGLPAWIRNVVDEEDEGKLVSEGFLKLERAEQERMQHALSTKVQYGTPMPFDKVHGDAKQGKVQIAGIEKGTKNRYKDMLPFEHARVRLQGISTDGCDYINASHIRPAWSCRSYIAAQAPVPATFNDFWRLMWEQDARVIVMLSAEMENGQRKCHNYWKADTYSEFKVRQLSEKRVSLEMPPLPSLYDSSRKASMPLAQLHNQRSFNRRATLGFNAEASDRPTMPGEEKEPAHCTVRKLTISNVQQPFAPLREITQIMYTGWPDLGAPAEASELLGLVEEVNHRVRISNNGNVSRQSGSSSPDGLRRSDEQANQLPAFEGQRPVVVHCSAGCGRTGTFVTVDSVCDMLKRQRMVAMTRRHQHQQQSQSQTPTPTQTYTPQQRQQQMRSSTSKLSLGIPNSGRHDSETNPFDLTSPDGRMQSLPRMDIEDDGHEIESEESGELDDQDKDLSDQDWVLRDDIDLVEKTVTDLRGQRISMVQNLRQYTLCYESVLEWLVREMPERFRREGFRKSYQG